MTSLIRMKNPIRLTIITLLLAVSSLSGATHYVSLGSTNPAPPYTNWVTAATNIQDAVNTASVGDDILVSDGVYQTGVTTVYGMRNRVAVTKPVAVRSVNGPAITVIVGDPNRSSAMRCVYLTNGAVLAGFTLTNGSTQYFADSSTNQSGGGVWCESASAVVTNCVLSGNLAYNNGGGACSGTLTNCVLSGNSAYNSGGGAYSGTLDNCTLTGNLGPYGGGATDCTLSNCTLAGNDGGGATGCTLYNCTLTGNWTWNGGGGGAGSCTLYNCTLVGNTALAGSGAGANGCTLYNCTLSRNSALYGGGGAASCTLNNCTLTGNSASNGGGATGCTLYNCITYFNTAPSGANFDSSTTLKYCCTTPLPTNGVDNVAFDPQLASASHLSADSPCRGAGSAAYATGTDIDGEAWNDPPSIGCDEYHAGAVTAALTVSLQANYTNVAPGVPVTLTALIEGRTTDSVWDFGDGDMAINEPYITHSWTQPGDYLVALWAFNETHGGGVNATVTIHVVGHPYYVAASGNNPQPPYASWNTAATNIQDAVDAAAVGALVLVTNGVYAGGITVANPLTLLSINGPQFTVITGGGTKRCVSLADGASLTGFTLTNGYSYREGGSGVRCSSTNALLAGCVIVTNSAVIGSIDDDGLYGGWGGGSYGGTLYNCTLRGNSAEAGGAAYTGTLNNCTLTGNSAWDDGGGAVECTLNNCTLTGNSAPGGRVATGCTLYNCTLSGNPAGGAASCTFYNCTLTGSSGGVYGPPSFPCALYNCIAYYNGPNYSPFTTLNYCCTTPLPTNGVGNITNAPLFVDYAAGNLHLQSTSPCINAGNNAYVTTTTDLDGNPRIGNGTVDIGAYEYQGTGSRISYAWLQQYGLPTDGSADFLDPDHDGMNNWQEWVSSTNPTNALSVLRMLSALPTGTNAMVTWQSVAGVNYFLERSANLAVPLALLATNIVGQAGITSYTDTNAASAGPFFYRVGVTAP